MRVIMTALLGLSLIACSGPAPTEPVADYAALSVEKIEQNAPKGPLPDAIFPTHYDLDLTLDPRQDRFGGTVRMTLQIDEAAQGVYMHGRDLDVTAVRSLIGEASVVEGAWQTALPSGVAWVDFGQVASIGVVNVEIDYTAPFDANLSGLFKVTEQGDAYALAKSESIQARRFMPGFDQPAFKAPFDISLIIPEGDSAISNAPEASVEVLDGGLKKVTFETTRPLPTYLLSLAVGSFDVVDAGMMPPNAVRSEPIPLRGFARRGKGPELALALETAPELVRVFEEALQLPYPYKKLDIVAAPQWPSGATELAAAITYRESRILANEGTGPAARRALLSIHAHEVGHMWFGNLVTPPWWDDLWLKEAFASWGEGASLSELYPGEGYELDAIADGIRAMGLDSLASARAVREPIALNENVRNAYDAITYNKGLSVIGMVDAYFGADVFRPALGKYVEAFEDGVADSPQFFNVIGEVTGEPDLTKAFRSFVEQNGLPLLSVNRAVSLDTGVVEEAITVTQSRYAPLGSNLSNDRVWTVPFCGKAGIGDDETVRVCKMFDTPDTLVLYPDNQKTDASEWVLPNAGGTGYWRFSMPYEMWQDLGRAFSSLEAGEKLATLDSVGAEFAAGRIDVQTVWRFVDEAVRDEERRVVQAAIRQAARFERHVADDPVALEGYRAAVIDVFKYRYEMLDQADDTAADAIIMETQLGRFLAGTARDAEIRESAARAAASFVSLPGASSERVLSSDEYASAMAIAMQDLGEPFLDRLIAARDEIDDPVFEQAVAYAIGQNNNPALSERILALVLSGDLGSRESYSISLGQMAQPETRALTWDWLRANFPAYLEVIPRQRKRATPGLGASLCSAEDRTALEALFAEHAALVEGYERSLAQTSERITLCAALEAAKGDEVRTYFSRKR